MSGDEGKLFTTKDIVVLALFRTHTDFEYLGNGLEGAIRKADEYKGQTKDALMKHLIGVNAIDDDLMVNISKQDMCNELASEELFVQFPWLDDVQKSFDDSGCTPYTKSPAEKRALINWINGVEEQYGKWQCVHSSESALMNAHIENEVDKRGKHIFFDEFGMN